MKVLSIEQAQYVLDTYKDDKAYLPIMLAILTGMRQGEICGLCWKDVDLLNDTISVTHSLQRQEGGLKLKEPKTKKSRRSIPIPTDVVKVLKKVEHQHKQDKLAFGEGFDKRGFVCAWDDGRPLDTKWLSKQWRRIRSNPKLSNEVRFHDLRHTHASILLGQGLNIKIVQERLGHESIVTTGDTYSHVTQAMSQEANRILDNVFCLSKEKGPKKYRVRRVCVKNVSNH